MNKQVLPTLLLVLSLLSIVALANAQIKIFNTDFGNTVNINPVGWIFTGPNMNINTINPSTGYTGASGGAKLCEGSASSFINTAGTVMPHAIPGVSTAVLLVNASDFSNIKLSFALQHSTSYKKKVTYVLEWSSDGIAYTPIKFNTVGGVNWNLVKGSGLNLPAAANHQPTLFFKWTFIRTGGVHANIKIDDFKLSGDSTCTPASILVQPTNPLPVCINNGTATITVIAKGSGVFTYQWLQDSVLITDNSIYNGCNLPELIVSNPPYTLNGKKFHCAVTNCAGGFTASSNQAQLTIKTLVTDINKDGAVDNGDFLLLNQHWGLNCNGCPDDLNGDGTIDVLDFLQLLSDFNKTCQ